jgi:hypothetical protein
MKYIRHGHIVINLDQISGFELNIQLAMITIYGIAKREPLLFRTEEETIMFFNNMLRLSEAIDGQAF